MTLPFHRAHPVSLSISGGINSKYTKCLFFLIRQTILLRYQFFMSICLAALVVFDIAVRTLCLASWVLVVANFNSLFSSRFISDLSFVKRFAVY